MVTSFIGVERHFQQCANKTDQLAICYTWHIVESGVKHK
jgi:hypothetical protein